MALNKRVIWQTEPQGTTPQKKIKNNETKHETTRMLHTLGYFFVLSQKKLV